MRPSFVLVRSFYLTLWTQFYSMHNNRLQASRKSSHVAFGTCRDLIPFSCRSISGVGQRCGWPTVYRFILNVFSGKFFYAVTKSAQNEWKPAQDQSKQNSVSTLFLAYFSNECVLFIRLKLNETEMPSSVFPNCQAISCVHSWNPLSFLWNTVHNSRAAYLVKHWVSSVVPLIEA